MFTEVFSWLYALILMKSMFLLQALTRVTFSAKHFMQTILSLRVHSLLVIVSLNVNIRRHCTWIHPQPLILIGCQDMDGL